MRVVFTNVDGSFWDAGGLGIGAASPALAAMERRNIPLVFVSRRTRAEILALQTRLELSHPAAYENGAAVFVPAGYFPASILDEGWEEHGNLLVRGLGLPYSHLRQVMQDVRVELDADMVGFGDWSEGELALALGLSQEKARLAHQREYSEIFTYAGQSQDLEQAIARHHLQVSKLQSSSLQGQWYLTGNADKIAAMQLLLDCYVNHVGQVESLGIGTEDSDAGWLHSMQRVVVLSGAVSDDAWWEECPQSWERSQLPGAEGWNEAVLNWLDSTDTAEE
ncbi:MAG: hypothetical protein AAGE92_05565 [Cyanobacteria bacterium P01_G01_bin.4]